MSPWFLDTCPSKLSRRLAAGERVSLKEPILILQLSPAQVSRSSRILRLGTIQIHRLSPSGDLQRVPNSPGGPSSQKHVNKHREPAPGGNGAGAWGLREGWWTGRPQGREGINPASKGSGKIRGASRTPVSLPEPSGPERGGRSGTHSADARRRAAESAQGRGKLSLRARAAPGTLPLTIATNCAAVVKATTYTRIQWHPASPLTLPAPHWRILSCRRALLVEL